MNDEEKAQKWSAHTREHCDKCDEWLTQVLFNPDLSVMMQLFQQHRYRLGTRSHEVYKSIFHAYIHGKTSLDHVRLFFSTLGGSFFTELGQDMCVWGTIAYVETNGTLTETMDDFVLRMRRIYNLVRCLATEFSMPVNPDRHFIMGRGARPLDMVRNHGAWMLYYCMASFYPDKSFTSEDLQRTHYDSPEIHTLWLDSGFLNTASGRIDRGLLDELSEDEYVQRLDQADQHEHREAFHNPVDQLAELMDGADIM
jgi:hypothetical protein